MTSLQRHGGGLLLLLGVALAAYGLVAQRDVAVMAGAFLAAAAVALDRFAPPPQIAASAVAAQLRADMEARIAERLRKARNT